VGLETAVLDIVLSYHAYHSLKLLGILRLFLKLLTSAAWFIILTVCYVHTWSHPSGLIKDIQGWLGKSWESSYLYVAAVVVYLVPNVIGGLFFLFPMLRRWIESSNWRIVRSLMWWSQVCFLFFCTSSFVLVGLMFDVLGNDLSHFLI
jgi:callose synthase